MKNNAEEIQSLIIDYIDGLLDESTRARVEALLQTDSKAKRFYDDIVLLQKTINDVGSPEPSDTLKENFNAMLRDEMARINNTRVIPMRPLLYRAAAVVLILIVGGGIGYWYSKQQQKDAELIALRQEMEATRKLVITMMTDEQSASQRMLGVMASYKTDHIDDVIVNALVQRMNEDPNSNVRITAIEALARFSNEESVRNALIASLATQQDPVVQIRLIQLMVEMKEKQALESLRSITQDETTIQAVRDEAHAGLFKLAEI